MREGDSLVIPVSPVKLERFAQKTGRIAGLPRRARGHRQADARVHPARDPVFLNKASAAFAWRLAPRKSPWSRRQSPAPKCASAFWSGVKPRRDRIRPYKRAASRNRDRSRMVLARSKKIVTRLKEPSPDTTIL